MHHKFYRYEQFSIIFCSIKFVHSAVVGLYRISHPVRKSGKFSKSGLSGNWTFSFPDAGLLTLLKIEKKLKKNFFFKFQGYTGVAVEVMHEVDQDPGTTIVVVIPRDQNLLLIELSSALLIIYNFFPVSFVTFILFFVFSFWSLLSTKLRKYKTITQSLLKFCKARWKKT